MTTSTEMPTSQVPDPLRERQRATWASGDYAVIGTTLQLVGELLAESLDLRTDERVLDVAAGNGNATLAAARRGARVTSTDLVEALLVRGRERAAAERLDVHFEIADAQALPFADGEFDAVMSSFGVMFAPDPSRSAAELLRVCRPGGRIGLCNWTPDGFVGQMLATIGSHRPPPAGASSPASWGEVARLHELFGHVADLAVTPRRFVFRYRSAEHFVDVFKSWYGPVRETFRALSGDAATALERDLLALLRRSDHGEGRGLVVPSDYLEVILRPRR
jgi:ubiquinone/menaquinone biosynthesis C-methylase UbiE